MAGPGKGYISKKDPRRKAWEALQGTSAGGSRPAASAAAYNPTYDASTGTIASPSGGGRIPVSARPPTSYQRLTALRKKRADATGKNDIQSKLRGMSTVSKIVGNPELDPALQPNSVTGLSPAKQEEAFKALSGIGNRKLKKPEVNRNLEQQFRQTVVEPRTDQRHAGLIEKAYPTLKDKAIQLGYIGAQDYKNAKKEDKPAAQTSPFRNAPDPDKIEARVENSQQRLKESTKNLNRANKRFLNMLTPEGSLKRGVPLPKARRQQQQAIRHYAQYNQARKQATKVSKRQQAAAERYAQIARRLVKNQEPIFTSQKQEMMDAREASLGNMTGIPGAGRFVKEAALDIPNIPENVLETGNLSAGVAKTFGETVKENPADAFDAAALGLMFTGAGSLARFGRNAKVAATAARVTNPNLGKVGGLVQGAKEVSPIAKKAIELAGSPTVQRIRKGVGGALVGGIVTDVAAGRITDGKVSGYVEPALTGIGDAVINDTWGTAKTSMEVLLSSVAAPFAIAGNVGLTTRRSLGALEEDATDYEKSQDYKLGPVRRLAEETLTEAKNMVGVYTSKDAEKIATATAEAYGILPAMGAFWLLRPFTKGAIRGTGNAVADGTLPLVPGGSIPGVTDIAFNMRRAMDDKRVRSRVLTAAGRAFGLGDGLVAALDRPIRRNAKLNSALKTSSQGGQLTTIIDEENQRAGGFSKTEPLGVLDLVLFRLGMGMRKITNDEQFKKLRDGVDVDSPVFRLANLMTDPTVKAFFNDDTSKIGKQRVRLEAEIMRANEILQTQHRADMVRQGRDNELEAQDELGKSQAIISRSIAEGFDPAERPSVAIQAIRDQNEAQLAGLKQSIVDRRTTYNKKRIELNDAKKTVKTLSPSERKRVSDGTKADRIDQRAVEAEQRALAHDEEAVAQQARVEEINAQMRGEQPITGLADQQETIALRPEERETVEAVKRGETFAPESLEMDRLGKVAVRAVHKNTEGYAVKDLPIGSVWRDSDPVWFEGLNKTGFRDGVFWQKVADDKGEHLARKLDPDEGPELGSRPVEFDEADPFDFVPDEVGMATGIKPTAATSIPDEMPGSTDINAKQTRLETRKDELQAQAEAARASNDLDTLDKLNEELTKIGTRLRSLASLERFYKDTANPIPRTRRQAEANRPDKAAKKVLLAKKKQAQRRRESADRLAKRERVKASERRQRAKDLRRDPDKKLGEAHEKVARLEGERDYAKTQVKAAIEKTRRFAEENFDQLTPSEHAAIRAQVAEELGVTAGMAPAKAAVLYTNEVRRLQKEIDDLNSQLEALDEPDTPNRVEPTTEQLVERFGPEAATRASGLPPVTGAMKADAAITKRGYDVIRDSKNDAIANRPREDTVAPTQRRVRNVAEAMGVQTRKPDGSFRDNADIATDIGKTVGAADTPRPRTRREVKDDKTLLTEQINDLKERQATALEDRKRAENQSAMTLRSDRIRALTAEKKLEKRVAREAPMFAELKTLFEQQFREAQEANYEAAIFIAQKAAQDRLPSGSPPFQQLLGTKKDKQRTGALAKAGKEDLSTKAWIDTATRIAQEAANTRLTQYLAANSSFLKVIDEKTGRKQSEFTEPEIRRMIDDKELKIEGEFLVDSKGKKFVKLDSRFLTDPQEMGNRIIHGAGGKKQSIVGLAEAGVKEMDAQELKAMLADSDGSTMADRLTQQFAQEGEGRKYALIGYEELKMVRGLEEELGKWDSFFLQVNRLNSKLVLGMSPSWALAQPIAEMLILWADHPNPVKLLKAAQEVKRIHDGPDSAAKRGLAMLAGNSVGISRSIRNTQMFHKDAEAGLKAINKTYGHMLMKEVATLEKPLGALDRKKGAFIREMGVLAEIDRELSTFRQVSKALMDNTDAMTEVSGILKSMNAEDRVKWLNSKEGIAAGERISRNIDAALGNWIDLKPGFERMVGSPIFFYPFVRFSINWTLRTFPKRHPGRWTAATMYGAYQKETLERLMQYDPQWMNEWAVAPIYGSQEGPPTSFFTLNRYGIAGNALSELSVQEGYLGFNIMKAINPLTVMPFRLGMNRLDAYGAPLTDANDLFGQPDAGFSTVLGQALDETFKMMAPARELMRLTDYSFKEGFDNGLVNPFTIDSNSPFSIERKPGGDPNLIRDMFRRLLIAGIPIPAEFVAEGQNVDKIYEKREEGKTMEQRQYGSIMYEGSEQRLSEVGEGLTTEMRKWKKDKKAYEDREGFAYPEPMPMRSPREKKIVKRYLGIKGERAWGTGRIKEADFGLYEYHEDRGFKLDEESTVRGNVESARRQARKNKQEERENTRKKWETVNPGFAYPGYGPASKQIRREEAASNDDGLAPRGTPGTRQVPLSGGDYNYDATQPGYTPKTPITTYRDQPANTPPAERIPAGSGIEPMNNVPRKRQVAFAKKIRAQRVKAFGSGKAKITAPGLSKSQRTFAEVLAKETGLDPKVVGGWVLAEQGYASGDYEARNYHNWLNIGPHMEAPEFSSPATAARATAAFLRGEKWGAGAGIPGILPNALGKSPEEQVEVLRGSGWDAAGYQNGIPWQDVTASPINTGNQQQAKEKFWQMVKRGKRMGVYEVPEGRNLMPVELVSAPGMSPDIEGVNRPIVKLAKHLARVVKEPEFSIISGLRAPSYGSNHEYGNALDIEAYSLNNEAGTKESEARGNKVAYEAVRVLGGKAAADKYRADGFNAWWGPNGEEVIWGYDDQSTGGNHTNHVHIAVPDGAPMPNVPSKPMSPMQEVKAARRAARAGNSAMGTSGGGTTGGTTSSTTESPGTQNNAIENLQNFRNPDGSILNWGTGTEMDLPSAAVNVSEANQNRESDKVKSVAESFAGLPKYVKPKPKKR